MYTIQVQGHIYTNIRNDIKIISNVLSLLLLHTIQLNLKCLTTKTAPRTTRQYYKKRQICIIGLHYQTSTDCSFH